MTLVIQTITGKTLEFEGEVTIKNTPDGVMYYIAGQSFPEQIVVEVK